MKRSFMKRFLMLGLAAIMFFTLISCGNNIDSSSDDMKEHETAETAETAETTETTEITKTEYTENGYRDFNLDDYKNGNFLIIPTKSLGADKIQSVQNWFYNNDKANKMIIETLMNDSLFSGDNGETCADMIDLGYVGTSFLGAKQYYYKINVKDIDRLKQNIQKRAYRSPIDTSLWSEQDEIYMLCDYYYPDEEARIDYYFKNYSMSDDLGEQDNTSADNEITCADGNTYCTEKTISTEWERQEAERKAQEEADAAAKESIENEIQRLSEEQFFNLLKIGEKAYSDTTAYSVKVLSADAEHITINIFNDGNYDHIIDYTIELTIDSYHSYPYSLEDVPLILDSSYLDDVAGFYDNFGDYYTTIHATDLSGNYSCVITIRSDSITLDGFDVMSYQFGDYFSLASVYYY